MIFISIENADISRETVAVAGANGAAFVHRDLRPGESARIALTGATVLSLSPTGEPTQAQSDAD